ncbi:hypothetical protein [Helicobacter japonicus]|nr:hypothetical protein [Helicobacter japonicus]
MKFAEKNNEQKNPIIKLTIALATNHAICPLVIESIPLDSNLSLSCE